MTDIGFPIATPFAGPGTCIQISWSTVLFALIAFA